MLLVKRINSYSNELTSGKLYEVIEHKKYNDNIILRITNDLGNMKWYPYRGYSTHRLQFTDETIYHRNNIIDNILS